MTTEYPTSVYANGVRVSTGPFDLVLDFEAWYHADEDQIVEEFIQAANAFWPDD